jgi:7-cyano-7-deazaguanine synthase
MDPLQKTVTLCCSGGIDSTGLIRYYLDKEYTIQGVHFDYGQPSYEGESLSLRKLGQVFGIPILFSSITPKPSWGKRSEYYGRNALFIFSALSALNQTSGLISLGIHANTDYYDCSSTFIDCMQSLLYGYYKGKVIIDVPFLTFTKADIIQYCLQNNVPLNLTYSCLNSSTIPCGSCLSCLERKNYGIC